MLRTPFEPRDLPTPRAGETPPRILGARVTGDALTRLRRRVDDASARFMAHLKQANPSQEADDDAKVQQAIADAVEGVIP